MKTIRKNLAAVMVAFMMFAIAMSSCSKRVGTTTLVIQDSCRHYYPILQGQELEVSYRIANIGKDPLVLTDINPSCGCISVEGEHNNIIMPDKEQTLRFKFDSSKYVGEAKLKIYLFGNIPGGMSILYFDVNVVPPSSASPDYEEYYYENEKLQKLANNFVNGAENERGYWINDGEYPEDYSMTYNRYPWREKQMK